MSDTEQTVTQATDRFQITVDDQTAGFAQFLDREGRRIFFHTEIGEDYGGQGLGGTLVGDAVRQSVDAGLTIVPVCPFVKKYLEQNTEHAGHVEKPTPQDLQALDGRG